MQQVALALPTQRPIASVEHLRRAGLEAEFSSANRIWETHHGCQRDSIERIVIAHHFRTPKVFYSIAQGRAAHPGDRLAIVAKPGINHEGREEHEGGNHNHPPGTVPSLECLNAEGVLFHSPGSRSAPWGQAGNRRKTGKKPRRTRRARKRGSQSSSGDCFQS
ncbi:hypothetical protein SV7mr_25920 [Stieleria bergensis]|uniref:Uncharacterized protein n=1 Tax=Stieleria bergensis TaxID=2528025 RepID=A0A517SVB7_9BACT|nr:hypothetical protein SV7mr_25920 [Planctomycetes bacterium SV_7m_r]